MANCRSGREGFPSTSAFDVSGAGNAMAANAATFVEACARAAAAWQQGCVRFVNARLKADAQAAAATAACKQPQDFLKLQSDWASGALQDYTSEWGRVMGIATAFASDAAEVPTGAAAAGEKSAGQSRQ
jgi:hypothetical protein